MIDSYALTKIPTAALLTQYRDLKEREHAARNLPRRFAVDIGAELVTLEDEITIRGQPRPIPPWASTTGDWDPPAGAPLAQVAVHWADEPPETICGDDGPAAPAHDAVTCTECRVLIRFGLMLDGAPSSESVSVEKAWAKMDARTTR